MPSLVVNFTSPTPGSTVSRTFTVTGQYLLNSAGAGAVLSRFVGVQFGPGTTIKAATISGSTWTCTGTLAAGIHPNSPVTITVSGSAYFDARRIPIDHVDATPVNMEVRTPAAIAPNISINAIPAGTATNTQPASVVVTGTASGVDAGIQIVQYRPDQGVDPIASALNTGSQYSTWCVTLPAPPGNHTFAARAYDFFGTGKEVFASFTVQGPPAPPAGTPTTLGGVPTTSSITSWTRLEPQMNGTEMSASSRARVFDPLWMLTRQWQMGEFQGEDAGSPVQARVRSTNAKLTRCKIGAASSGMVQAPAYDAASMPLEVMVERRRMRPSDDGDARLLSFAIDAGLHFLRMLELAGLSKSYRAVFIARLVLQPISPSNGTIIDAATDRYVQSMLGRAPDGRLLAKLLRTTGAAQLVAETALNIATADRPKVQQAATNWLAWYDSICSEPASAAEDGWIPQHLEYGVCVGTRLSASAADDVMLSASEVDGSPLDWSAFDVNFSGSLGTSTDQSFTSSVEVTVPAPVNFAGLPAARFWEMEDSRVTYGYLPVGPHDLGQLMMVEYASTYGNDWFIVPMTVPVGSITRVDSLVVTDTFGVRNLVRPIGDPALPPANFSMWQLSTLGTPPNATTPPPKIATNRFFLPPTLPRTLDSPALEEVLLMRDEMANIAWAIERSVENPLERAAQRYDTTASVAPAASTAALPQYRLSSTVPTNWIPLLPVQPDPAAPNAQLSRLRRGAVLQIDGSPVPHTAKGELLNCDPQLVLCDEEVPRDGALLTRQRRMTRWSDGSTWLWTSFRNQTGRGEGSSALEFDHVVEPGR